MVARLRWAAGRRAGLRGTGYEQSGRDGGYGSQWRDRFGLAGHYACLAPLDSRSGHPCSHPHESSTASCRVSFREIVRLGS